MDTRLLEYYYFRSSNLKKIVGFNDMHDMQGCEEQLLNAMYDFETCVHE